MIVPDFLIFYIDVVAISQFCSTLDAQCSWYEPNSDEGSILHGQVLALMCEELPHDSIMLMYISASG